MLRTYRAMCLDEGLGIGKVLAQELRLETIWISKMKTETQNMKPRILLKSQKACLGQKLWGWIRHCTLKKIYILFLSISSVNFLLMGKVEAIILTWFRSFPKVSAWPISHVRDLKVSQTTYLNLDHLLPVPNWTRASLWWVHLEASSVIKRGRLFSSHKFGCEVERAGTASV